MVILITVRVMDSGCAFVSSVFYGGGEANISWKWCASFFLTMKMNCIKDHYLLLHTLNIQYPASCFPLKTSLMSLYRVQWFSARDSFVPQETFVSAWKHLLLSQLGVGGKCYWHPVCRGQRYCWTSDNAQDMAPPQRMIW